MFRFRPLTLSSDRDVSRQRNVAAPGLVWGEYPEHREPERQSRGITRWFDQPAVRSTGLRSIHSLAGRCAMQARALAAADDITAAGQTPEAIRRALLKDGLSPAGCCAALAWIGFRIKVVLGIELHVNQYECALRLVDQSLAEMATGEGKTLAAAAAAALMAIAGSPVHLLTANEYLAERDATGLRALYDDLGLSVAFVLEKQPPEQRRLGYRADIVYATARALAFDYLRDRLVRRPQNHTLAHDEHAQLAGASQSQRLMLRGLCCAIIDEADGILLDEAKTPLIIADARSDPAERGRLWQALDLAGQLRIEQSFRIHRHERLVQLTEEGAQRLHDAARGYGGAWNNRQHREHLVVQALTALHLLIRDVDYIVRGQEIVIVDATTGRAAEGRQWSMGLHALVALKEKCPMPTGSRTLASLTYPRLFSRYHHLCGLSGTLREDRRELLRTYGLHVHEVARHQPLRRTSGPLRCFRRQEDLVEAVTERATALATMGRSVLIATDTVEDSEALYRRLAGTGLTIALLNASQTRDEATTIAAAGTAGHITIATQVAGRGTDIRLCERVRANGGLHVLNLQANRSSRIDRQIVGRCARQGDPGSAEHWLCLEKTVLTPSRAPSLLRPWMGLMALVCATPYRPGLAAPALGARLAARSLLYAYQQYCRSEDATGRRRALSGERDWAHRLHFAAVVE